MLKLTLVSLATIALALVGAGYYLSTLPPLPVSTIKLTYELNGEQFVEEKSVREFGRDDVFAAMRFAVLQNRMAASSYRPMRKVVGLERCSPKGECSDWMPEDIWNPGWNRLLKGGE